MAGTDGAIIQGAYDLSNVQDRLRKYAQDGEVFKFWALRQQNTISVLKVISEKFGTVPAQQLTDWEFKYNEFDELPYSFVIGAATGLTNKFEISIPNADAALLDPSIRLTVVGSYTKSTVAAVGDVAATKVFSATQASAILYPEVLRIISKGADDSAYAGYTKVSVRRAHGVCTDTVYAGLTLSNFTALTGLTVVCSNIANAANSYPLEPVSKNADLLSNYIQITRRSYGVGEHLTAGGGIETYLAKGNEYLNMNYMLAENFMMKTIEKAMLTSKKNALTIGNNLCYDTGGILEFIPSSNWLDAGGKVPSVSIINNLIRRMADEGGVKELWMFTGTELAEQIATAYEDKRTFCVSNAKLSVEYQMLIKTIEGVGRDIVVHHVVAPILNEIGMGNSALCLNLSEINWNEKSKFGSFQIATKVPFSDKPDGIDGYKKGEGYNGTWRELYGAWGLVRRLPETHFVLDNFAPVNNA